VELPLTFGLRDSTEATVEIRWPDGTEQKLENLPVDRFLKITQGESTFESI
jgi:hypothetical protein